MAEVKEIKSPQVTVDHTPVSSNEGIESEEDVVTFPEGGLRGWMAVLGGSLVLFCTLGGGQAFGVFQDYYTRVILNDHSPSQVSWIGSFQIFLLYAMGIFTGRLFDDGYFHHMMIAGTLVYLFSFFMLSLTKPHQYYQMFLSQGLGLGIGVGLLILPALTISSHYFQARRSLAMGVIFGGSSIGGVIFPIMLNRLFQSVGFAWGVRAAAFLSLGLLVIANLIMKTRLPSRKERIREKKSNIKGILGDVGYWLSVWGSFFVSWGLFFPYFYLQLFAVLNGVPEGTAFYAVTILNGASLFGRTLPNFLADRIGPLNVMIPACAISGSLIFAMFGAGSTGGMIVFAILYGFFSGGCISLIAPILASWSKSIDEMGARIGISMFTASFALLTGTPITGALLNPPANNWYRPIVFSGVSLWVGAVLMVISRFMLARQKGTWRV